MKTPYYDSLSIHIVSPNVEISIGKTKVESSHIKTTLWIPLAVVLFPIFLTILTPVLMLVFSIFLIKSAFYPEKFIDPSTEEVEAYYSQGKDYISSLSEKEKAELFRKKDNLPLGL